MSEIDDSWYERAEGMSERTGAGGVIVRLENGAILTALVKEVALGDSGYVIPKGGVESGETREEAARREIAEETGLTEIDRIGDLGSLARGNFGKTYWQVSHYGLYVTSQVEGVITDPANYGLGWFGLDALPDMFWPDEARLIVSRLGYIEERAKRTR